MGILWRLLGAELDAAEEPSGMKERTSDFVNWISENLKDFMSIAMPIVLSVVLAFGVFFCIKLGIAYAKAEKTEDREEAKKRLVGAVIGFGIGIIGAAVMWILFTNDSVINAIFS